MKRTLPELIDLAKRVIAHCEAGPWSEATTVRLNAAHTAWKRDPRHEVDHMNVYDFSRTYRCVASWNSRHDVVAKALAAELRALGVTAEMLS